MILYFSSIVAEDEETQRKGFVMVAAPKINLWEAYQKSSIELRRDAADLHQSAPVRMSAMHLCLPDGPANKLLRTLIFLRLFADSGRLRIRVHAPISKIETRYDLMSFGIPVHEFPLSSTGTVKNRNHLQWIKTRNLVEQQKSSDPSFVGIVHPAVHDVLFSKGGNTAHYGNIEFRHILNATCPIYNIMMDRNKRRQLRCHIIDFVTKERKGRFLQMDPNGNSWWVEISDVDVLMEKIGTALYDNNRKLKARGRQQQSQSDTDDFINAPKRRKLSDSIFCHGEIQCL